MKYSNADLNSRLCMKTYEMDDLNTHYIPYFNTTI